MAITENVLLHRDDSSYCKAMQTIGDYLYQSSKSYRAHSVCLIGKKDTRLLKGLFIHLKTLHQWHMFLHFTIK